MRHQWKNIRVNWDIKKVVGAASAKPKPKTRTTAETIKSRVTPTKADATTKAKVKPKKKTGVRCFRRIHRVRGLLVDIEPSDLETNEWLAKHRRKLKKEHQLKNNRDGSSWCC